jgi:hypothetical protein
VLVIKLAQEVAIGSDDSWSRSGPSRAAISGGILVVLSNRAACFSTVNREEKLMDGRPVRYAEYPWSPRDIDLLAESSKMHQLVQENRMLMRLTRLAKCARSATSR